MKLENRSIELTFLYENWYKFREFWLRGNVMINFFNGKNGPDILSKASIFASATCAVHCLLMPLLVPVLSLTGLSFLVTEKFEFFTIIFAFFACFSTLIVSFYKYHRSLLPFYYLSMSLLTFFARSYFLVDYEVVFNLFIGLFIIAAVLINKRLCKHCPSCS